MHMLKADFEEKIQTQLKNLNKASVSAGSWFYLINPTNFYKYVKYIERLTWQIIFDLYIML